eukprot:1129024-Lingulodinium_polyedra.AAC.1
MLQGGPRSHPLRLRLRGTRAGKLVAHLLRNACSNDDAVRTHASMHDYAFMLIHAKKRACLNLPPPD